VSAPLNIGVGDLDSSLDVSYLPVITLQNNAPAGSSEPLFTGLSCECCIAEDYSDGQKHFAVMGHWKMRETAAGGDSTERQVVVFRGRIIL